MEKNNQKTKSSIIKKSQKQIIAIAFALVLVIGGTFAWLTITLTGTKTTKLTAGTLALTLDESTSDGINITDAVPMSDTKGLATTAYTFSLKNTGSISSVYEISLTNEAIDSTATRMSESFVKYSLTKNDGTATTALVSSLSKNASGNYILDSGTIASGTTNTYTLRVWIDSTATTSDINVTTDGFTTGKVFSDRLSVNATQVEE